MEWLHHTPDPGTLLELPETSGPELTALGKRIELLRIERRLSKQHLARQIGTSRQQLWRVMTGKSELTSSLRLRLADALAVGVELLGEGPIRAARPEPHGQRATLHPPSAAGRHLGGERVMEPTPAVRASSAEGGTRELPSFLGTRDSLERALALLPAGPAGVRIGRRLLDAIEDEGLEAGLALPSWLFDLRRRVLAGEL
jgi:transcriptional regulator with XRE-family HTH domain